MNAKYQFLEHWEDLRTKASVAAQLITNKLLKRPFIKVYRHLSINMWQAFLREKSVLYYSSTPVVFRRKRAYIPVQWQGNCRNPSNNNFITTDSRGEYIASWMVPVLDSQKNPVKNLPLLHSYSHYTSNGCCLWCEIEYRIR